MSDEDLIIVHDPAPPAVVVVSGGPEQIRIANVAVPGSSGETGTQGPPGLSGSSGETGPPGIPGSSGLAGPQGIAGSSGATGIAGSSGATGAQGIPGSSGLQGVAGSSGETGAQGIPGSSGAAGTSRQIAALTTTPATSGTGETALWAVAMPVAAGVAGTTYRIRLGGTSSSTGTLVFRVRVGANGTTGDAILWTGTTSVAQVANAHANIDVLTVVMSATTMRAEGFGTAGAVALGTLIGAAFDATYAPTSAWKLTVTCACSAGVFTARSGSLEQV